MLFYIFTLRHDDALVDVSAPTSPSETHPDRTADVGRPSLTPPTARLCHSLHLKKRGEAAWISDRDYCWMLLCRRDLGPSCHRPLIVFQNIPKLPWGHSAFPILLPSHNALHFKSLPSDEVAWVTLHCS